MRFQLLTDSSELILFSVFKEFFMPKRIPDMNWRDSWFGDGNNFFDLARIGFLNNAGENKKSKSCNNLCDQKSDLFIEFYSRHFRESLGDTVIIFVK